MNNFLPPGDTSRTKKLYRKIGDVPRRVLRGLEFCVHTRPAPAKFKPASRQEEFDKFCPHTPR